MASVSVADSKGRVFGEGQLLAEYNKLIKLRDDVFASQDMQVKVSKPSVGQGNSLSAIQHLPAASVSQASNGFHKPVEINSAAPTQVPNLHVPKPPSNPIQSKSPSVQKLPTPTPGSSGIDPIFLEKSDVLVRAELEQKRQREERERQRAGLEQKRQRSELERQRIQQQRQRIEHILEEQNLQKERHMARNQDALPDFDATEVLRKAQELVKPNKSYESGRANGSASSSDSFDENTFYSSQMDESTTTEEADDSRKADESGKQRPHQLCNFFRRGEHCKFGEDCVFSHDPALKQKKLAAHGSQAMDLDNVNADEQASLRHDNAPGRRGPATSSKAHHAVLTERETLPTSLSEKEHLLQERVAQLEAELRNSKAEKQGPPDMTRRSDGKDQHDSQEESAYSPPPPDEFGRDGGLREPVQSHSSIITQQPPRIYAQPVREYDRRNGRLPSPLPNNMRIVQNNLPSPVAPQPQRVSPLAVAKAPQVAQLQRDESDGHRAYNTRPFNSGFGSAGPSPNTDIQPLSSKKRRRGRDSGEQSRNVVARRGNDSPAVRIKAEAISPPPFAGINSIREIRQNQEQPRQFYVDITASQNRDQEPVPQQPRINEPPAHGQLVDDRRPITPLARPVISHNGQHYIANGEPDLRRVVSARQVRAPLSPAPYPVQYSAPQHRGTRAASQVFVSPSAQGVPQQYRASDQPQQPAYVNDRTPSPIRRMPQSPIGRHSIIMAPPPRRIVVDQYGNQFEEVSVPRERQVSLMPVRGDGDYDPRYTQPVPRSASVRHSQYVDHDEEGQYIRRAPSPTSPTYVEYPQPTRTRQVIGSRGKLYEDDPYTTRNDGPRAVEYSDARPPARYEEVYPPREGTMRMQSVRPTERHYESMAPPQEGNVRMHSIRPLERHYDGLPPPRDEPARMQSVRAIERQYEMPQERIQRVQSVRPQPRIVSLGEKAEARPQIIRQVSVRPENASVRQMEHIPNERQRYQYGGQGQEGAYVEEMDDGGRLYEAQGSGGRRAMQRM